MQLLTTIILTVRLHSPTTAAVTLPLDSQLLPLRIRTIDCPSQCLTVGRGEQLTSAPPTRRKAFACPCLVVTDPTTGAIHMTQIMLCSDRYSDRIPDREVERCTDVQVLIQKVAIGFDGAGERVIAGGAST